MHPLASKSCELEPVPSRIILGCFQISFALYWSGKLLSLETSVMPTELKQAVIRPLWKKPSLDYKEFQNFRPISNLTFLSKVIEKVVALQLVDLRWTKMVCVKFFKSAYRANGVALKRLLSGSTMILLCALTIKNLLFWFNWICYLPSKQLIILFCFQDYLPVLACDQALDWLHS